MTRRDFITLLICAAATWPLAARTQPKRKMFKVGVLWHAGSEEEERVPLGALRDGLKGLGYVDGQTVVLEHRYPNEEPALFQRFADELAQLDVDVLVAITRQAALAAQRATKTIPVVFLSVPDPVESGLVASLGRPGGNITGYSNMAVELTQKRIELLKEAVPGLSRIGLLVNGSYQEVARRNIAAGHAAAAHLGMTVEPIEVRKVDDFENAFSSIKQQGLQGVASTVDGLFYANMKRLADLALKQKLPMVMNAKEMCEAGAFLTYGPNIPAYFRRAGEYIDKILKGTKPSDLPVEQPTTFDFYVNAATAKSLGLTVPPNVLARVDGVIE